MVAIPVLAIFPAASTISYRMRRTDPYSTSRAFDTFRIGRSYAGFHPEDVGVDFVPIKSFVAYVEECGGL